MTSAHSAWEVVTRLGSASLMLPILGFLIFGLIRSGQGRALRPWFYGMALASILVLGSKLVFMGWGIGIATLDFTGISGHAFLSAAILPVWLGWVLTQGKDRISLLGVVAGLLLAMLVAWSRIVVHAHSVSEIVPGWLLGALITWLAYRDMKGSVSAPWMTKIAGVLLLLVLSQPISSYLQARQWEIRIALLLSGRDVPYARGDLGRQAVASP